MSNRNSRTVAPGHRGRLRRSVLVFGGLWSVLAVGLCAVPARGGDDEMGIVVDPRIRGANVPDTFVPDEFIVVLSAEARRNAAAGVDRTGRPTINVASLQDVVERHGVIGLTRQFPTARAHDPASGLPDLTGHYKARIGPGADLDVVMGAFARDPAVRHVEKIGVHYVRIEPNDTFYRDPPPSFPHDQWHYWDTFGIDANLAWDDETGDPNVVVAITDTGVRYFHIDLGGNNAPWGPDDPRTNGNIFVNAAEIPGNGIDDDGNGFIDDTVGYDFVASSSALGCSCLDQDCGTVDNDPDDGDGHGTHVAGTVGAVTNNARAVAGVAGGFSDGTTTGAGNGAKVLPLRIGWRASCFGLVTGVVRMDYAAAAFQYVADLVDAGVNVTAINASWGSSNSGGIDAAVDAVLARDVMVIVAAGNSNSTSPSFLSTKEGTMSVAATTRSGAGASFTNHGDWVDLAAPGVDIMSTYRNPDDPDPNNHYVALLSGTSMSAPHACGVAALLESCASGLSGPDKFGLLVATTEPYSDSRDLGSGILNARNALDAAGCSGQPQCTDNADCDDGDPCTTDTCTAGTCSNTPIDCNDGDACTADACVGGSCQNDPISCDDGDLCTIDSCDPDSGCSNVPVDCNDGDACTADSCDPDSGSCVNTPIDCDDGNECTSDACVAGSCENTPVADGTLCSGGICCDGACVAAACSSDADCDDADACTTDACSSPDTCSASCLNDPIVCPPGETCVNGVCEPQVCNDNGVCDSGEDCDNCPQDCPGSAGGFCGDGVCAGAAAGEDCFSCPADCRCTGGPDCKNACCGDGVCSGENANNCPVDCDPGFTPPSGFCCGDGVCENGEDSCNCSIDCGSPTTSETSCTDGADNDCDGAVDCDDPDCDGDPGCACAPVGDACTVDADCCSNKCRGPSGGKTCK